MVEFKLNVRKDLRYYDAIKQTYAVEPGDFEIQIGGSSKNIQLKKNNFDRKLKLNTKNDGRLSLASRLGNALVLNLQSSRLKTKQSAQASLADFSCVNPWLRQVASSWSRRGAKSNYFGVDLELTKK